MKNVLNLIIASQSTLSGSFSKLFRLVKLLVTIGHPYYLKLVRIVWSVNQLRERKGKIAMSCLFMKVTNTDSIEKNSASSLEVQDEHRLYRLCDRALDFPLCFPAYSTSSFCHDKNGFASESIQIGKVWRMGCHNRLHRWHRNIYS